MFCTKCGKEISDDSKYCVYCGEQISKTAGGAAKLGEIFGRNPSKSKKIVLFSAAFLVIVIAGIFLLSKGGNNRTDFNIEYSPEGVEKFLNVVCKNVDGEYAKVTDPNYDGPAYGSCYTAVVEIKQSGSVAAEAQMRFYNQNDSDKVSWGQIIFYGDDSPNEFNCRKALAIALEKTLCGASRAEEYITSYNDIGRLAYSLDKYNEENEMAEYWITDDLKVEITYKKSSFGTDWYLFYQIRKY